MAQPNDTTPPNPSGKGDLITEEEAAQKYAQFKAGMETLLTNLGVTIQDQVSHSDVSSEDNVASLTSGLTTFRALPPVQHSNIFTANIAGPQSKTISRLLNNIAHNAGAHTQKFQEPSGLRSNVISANQNSIDPINSAITAINTQLAREPDQRAALEQILTKGNVIDDDFYIAQDRVITKTEATVKMDGTTPVLGAKITTSDPILITALTRLHDNSGHPIAINSTAVVSRIEVGDLDYPATEFTAEDPAAMKQMLATALKGRETLIDEQTRPVQSARDDQAANEGKVRNTVFQIFKKLNPSLQPQDIGVSAMISTAPLASLARRTKRPESEKMDNEQQVAAKAEGEFVAVTIKGKPLNEEQVGRMGALLRYASEDDRFRMMYDHTPEATGNILYYHGALEEFASIGHAKLEAVRQSITQSGMENILSDGRAPS